MDLSTSVPDCNNHAVALDLAGQGFAVFPCVGKTPHRGVLWGHWATTDASKLNEHWGQFPNATPAIPCEKSKLVVIDADIDGENDGIVWLTALCPDEHKAALAATPGCWSPSGGRHFYFRNNGKPIGCGRGRLPTKTIANIDVKGEGGYVIAPGADTSGQVEDGGVYHQIGDLADLPELPDWLRHHLEPAQWQRAWEKPHQQPPQGKPMPKPRAPVVPSLEAIEAVRRVAYGAKALAEIAAELANAPEGSRNDMANKLGFRAGRLVAGGCIDHSEAVARLEEAVLSWGVPPSDKALGPRGTIQRGIRDGQERAEPAGPSDDTADDDDLMIDLPMTDRQGEEAKEGAKPAPAMYEVFWHGQAIDRELVAWLVEDLLPVTGCGLLSGQWGAGKTFVALDLAASVMTGRPFAGRAVARKGGVLFIAAEGAFHVPLRLKGLVDHKLGITSLLPFGWIEACPNLQNKDSVALLMASIEHSERHIREKFDLPLALIMIDTVTAAAHFKDANDAAEAQRLMNTKVALSRATGALVLGVDHFGKMVDTGTRGSSAKEGAADVVLAVLGEKAASGSMKNLRMAVRKNRAAPVGEETSFNLQVVNVDEKTTTCIVDWDERAGTSDDVAIGLPRKNSKADRRWRNGAGMVILKKALDFALEGGKRIRPYGSVGPEVLAVACSTIEGEFLRRYIADRKSAEGGLQEASKRKAFERALRNAEKQELIYSLEVDGVDMVWLAQGDSYAHGNDQDSHSHDQDSHEQDSHGYDEDDPPIISE